MTNELDCGLPEAVDKVNVIARLEFELAVQHFTHYSTRNP